MLPNRCRGLETVLYVQISLLLPVMPPSCLRLSDKSCYSIGQSSDLARTVSDAKRLSSTNRVASQTEVELAIVSFSSPSSSAESPNCSIINMHQACLYLIASCNILQFPSSNFVSHCYFSTNTGSNPPRLVSSPMASR